MAIIEQIIHAKLKNGHINILSPKTIQDKLNWLKFHGSTPLKGRCADKIALHDYSKEILGEDICVPIVKVYNNVSDIKLSDLPDKFIMKANHGYNMNIICKDKTKFDLTAAKLKLDAWLKTNFGHDSGQPHYQYINPTIFVETLLEDQKQQNSLFDYKFWCFNGKVRMWTINDGLGHGDIMYFDLDDQEIDLYETGKHGKYEKPENLALMKEYAEKLAARFVFVRVDFYEVDGKVYLGEMTFTPGNCLFKYKRPGANEAVGSFLSLPINKKYPEGVSVCLTAYKAQDFIEETLNSIANQTWFKTHNNWEIIVGIDGCHATLEKVKAIMKKYKNLRVLMMASNCGTYVTTNTVMSQAKYDGLIRFDSDDIMYPGMVETIMKEKDDANFVNFQLTNFGKRSGTNKACGQVYMKHTLFDKVGGYLPWTCSADSELEMRIRGIAKIKYIKKPLFKRRAHGGNLTMRKDTGYRSTLRMANMRYAMSHKNGFINKQDAVAVLITNEFTEIKDQSTIPVMSKHPFPKMDVIYQERMEWKLEKEKKAVERPAVSAVVDNYVYDEDRDLKKKTYQSMIKSNPLTRKRKASDFLKEYLAK